MQFSIPLALLSGGKDFITPRPNAQWMTLKWVMLALPKPGQPEFPLRGVYGHNVFQRLGMSGSGLFCQGFGAVADDAKPALLWLYNHTFRDSDARSGGPCDTINAYPHRALLAFVNWPFGLAEKNPATVLPCAVEDKRMGFYMFRNRWQDADDIVVTALLKGSKGNYSVPGGEIMVWGLGQKTKFPVKITGDTKYFQAGSHGGVLATSAGSFGVDFSGASGAEDFLVLSGPVQGNARGKAVQTVEAGGTKITLMTLQKGAPPEAKAEGDAVKIGQQTVRVAEGHLVFGRQP